MQRTTRTPPKYSSNPDLPVTEAEDAYINMRKRKQPDDAELYMKLLEQKFDEQLAVWNHKIDRSISEVINSSIKSCLSNEFSKISDSLEVINNTVTSLRSDNANFKESLSAINTRLVDMEKSLDHTNERQDSFDSQLKSVHTQLAQINDLPNHVQQLEAKLANMEQQARDCNIEIVNLPEKRNENLSEIVMKLGTVIKQQITSSDIVALHRVPHADQKDTRPKNVILKLTTRVLRDNVLASYRATKILNAEQLGISGTSLSTQKIYLNEHLTLKNKRLFRESRVKANMHDYKYVWVKHGIILARKSDTSPVLAIRTEQDLSRFK